MIWGYVLCALILLMGIFFSIPGYSAERISEEDVILHEKKYLIETLKIANHTYIHFRRQYDSYDSHIWHDPDCKKCLKDKEEK